MARSDPLLIVADSERDADLLYATGFFSTDPFVYLRIDGQAKVYLQDAELDRARRHVVGCEVGALSDHHPDRDDDRRPAHFAAVIRAVLKRAGHRHVTVPTSFPAEMSRELRRLKLKVNVAKGAVFPAREIKTSAEVKKISAALTMAEVGLSEGIEALRRARIGRTRILHLQHSPLTSERLRGIIESAVAHAGGTAVRTFVSCGRQSGHPLERGSGPLKADEPIILDVFPRSQKTGYHADITRTVVKGRASEAVRRLFDTVKTGQKLALGLLRDGVLAASVHRAVADYFVREGFETGVRRGRFEGFFHPAGHGLGLELHEQPKLSESSRHIVRAGQVLAVEPGLYYPGVGGVRLEDVVLVEADRCRNLTKFEKQLEV
jgi:Xaa-Pro aminopeptidase